MPSSAKHDGIIILGAPRSGTTLLRRLFDAHPNISCPGETFLFTGCARFLHTERVADGMEVGVLNGLHFTGAATDDVVARLRNFAFSFCREYALRDRKARWAEKTAVASFHLDQIDQLCGEHAYFVCLTRHGLDVVCSLQEWCDKNQVYVSELHQYIQRYPRRLEAFAHAWVDVTNAMQRFRARHPENVTMIRYEDLVAQPEVELRRIFDFVGEPWEPSLIQDAMGRNNAKGFSDWKTFSKTTIDSCSIGRWRNMSPNTLRDLAQIVNPTLQTCGYDAVSMARERSNEENRRCYEIGLLLQGTLQRPKP